MQPTPTDPSSKVKVADYIAGKQVNSPPIEPPQNEQAVDRAEVLRQRETYEATRRRGAELEQLIRKKKELSVLGISEQEPEKINRLHQSKANP